MLITNLIRKKDSALRNICAKYGIVDEQEQKKFIIEFIQEMIKK